MLLTTLGATAATQQGAGAAARAMIVADEMTRIAAIVNPVDLEQTLEYLQVHNLRLRYIFSTCSDTSQELSDSPKACAAPVCQTRAGCRTELAFRTGAKRYVFHDERADSSTFGLLKPGDVIEFGLVRLRVAQSASKALALLVYDLAIDDRTPQAEWVDVTDSNLSNLTILNLGDSKLSKK